jgi:hypothetical protein
MFMGARRWPLRHLEFLPNQKLLHCETTHVRERRSMSHVLARALEHAPSERLAAAGSEPGAEGQPSRDAQARASQLVAGIAVDAAADPELYLRSTVVPEGGE